MNEAIFGTCVIALAYQGQPCGYWHNQMGAVPDLASATQYPDSSEAGKVLRWGSTKPYDLYVVTLASAKTNLNLLLRKGAIQRHALAVADAYVNGER